MLAKQGQFWKTLVKYASFVKYRFLTRVFGAKKTFFRKKKELFFNHIDEPFLRISKGKSEYQKVAKYWLDPLS